MRHTRGIRPANTSREGPPRPAWGGARWPQALPLPLPARRLDRQRLAMQARALQALHGRLRGRGIGHLEKALGLAGGLSCQDLDVLDAPIGGEELPEVLRRDEHGEITD